jgi:PAS domain S-box-containing protein
VSSGANEYWGRRELLGRTVPFALIMVLAFGTVPLGKTDSDDELVIVALALTAALLATVTFTPWRRLPRWAGVIPAFAGLGIIVILRHAEGGAVSGYGVLALIPPLWLALYGTRRELILMIVAVALAFIAPIFIFGPPEYPDHEWRRAIIVTAMAGFVGFVTQNLVFEIRARAKEAELRARAEAEREAYVRAVMDSAAEGIVAFDREGNATFANQAAARLCGYEVEELIGERFHDLVHHSHPDGRPYPAAECPVFDALRTGRQHTVSDEVFWRKDGTSFPVEYRATAMVVEDVIVGVVNTFFDISERLAAQRTKDEFVSVVSHELRTPLTSIRGSLGLMEGGVMGDLPDDAQKMVSIAISNADRLVRLINDILDADRIESGKAPMAVRDTELAELMAGTADLLSASAEEAGVTLDVHPLKAHMRADPDRITQTLVNLIGNAIKFSGEGTTVRVDGEIEEGYVHEGLARVFVRDEGPGIPEEQQAAVFDRYVQADSAATRAKGGSGLGLSIAQRIVEQHGGRIWIDSSGEAGTTFAFELPLARHAKENTGGLGSGASVLIVEDDVDLAEVLATSLSRHGVQSQCVTSLELADQALREGTPSLLILDVDLPGTGLDELVAWMRETGAAAESEVLVYTALDLEPEELALLRQCGEVITKGRVGPREFERRALAKLGAGDSDSG